MRKLLLLSTLLVFVFTKAAIAQEDKRITDLLFLYADEKYDKLVYKSKSLIGNDKYKKHPIPYICASLGYYELSRNTGKFDVGEKDSEFPKPLKNSQKYLAKYLKVEKKAKKYFPDYEATYEDYREFYESIADTSNKLAQHFFLIEKPNKAASVYKAAFKAVPDNPVLLLWQGISEIKSKNTEGKKNILLALEKIDENYEPVESTSGVIARGMLIVEEYMTQIGDVANAKKAKKLVEVFKKYDPDELNKEKMAKRKSEAKSKDEIMRKFYSDEDDDINAERKKGNVTIQDGTGSRNAEDELDRLEREARGE